MAKLFLLADDDFDDAELFSEAVKNIDPYIDFRHVEDGHGILNFLESEQEKMPDIIFLDINMLLATGWECLTMIKNNVKYRRIPVIMYSTSANNMDKEKAKKLGASGFLTKPSDFRILVAILKKLATVKEVSLWE
jgi:CheY-like chemotaxis protein